MFINLFLLGLFVDMVFDFKNYEFICFKYKLEEGLEYFGQVLLVVFLQ